MAEPIHPPASPGVPPALDETPPAVVPEAVTPTVAADIEADAKGEDRPTAPSPTPPGTDRSTFWWNPATRNALWVTVGLFLFTVYALVDFLFTGAWNLSADAVKLEIGTFVLAWAAAFGIHKTDGDVLRWK